MVDWKIEYEHSGPDYETVNVRVSDLMRDFQKTTQFNLEGQNPLGDSPVSKAKRGYYEELLQNAQDMCQDVRIGMPAMGLDADQNPIFSNGRHRFAALFNQQVLNPDKPEYAAIPVRVLKASAPIFLQKWGSPP